MSNVGLNASAGSLNFGANQIGMQTAGITQQGMQTVEDNQKSQDAQQKYSQAASQRSSISSLMHNLAKEIIGNFPKR